MHYKKWYFYTVFRQNILTNVFDTAISSQRVSDGVNLKFIPCLNEPQMFCFVCECQVPGMRQCLVTTLQQLRVCAISTFWSALSFSFYFAWRVFFYVITLFSSAIWVQDNHEPPKCWKIDEENDAERRKKNEYDKPSSHSHYIFCANCIYLLSSCCLLPIYLFSLFNCYTPPHSTLFVTWKNSLGILIWDGIHHDFPHSNEWNLKKM